MCTFFHEVKKNCTGSIISTWFMSDIAPQYYTAWVGVMNHVPWPQKLLCTWNVDKAINMELRKKIGYLSTEAEIYKMFRTVLEQTNESLFEDCLRALLHRLSLSSKTPRSISILCVTGSIGSISGHIVLELVSESTRTCLWKPSTEFSNTDI